MLIEYDNESFVTFRELDEQLSRKIMALLSPVVEGYLYTHAYKYGFWDGRERHYEITKDLGLRIPRGLLGYLNETLGLDLELPRYELDKKDFLEFVRSLNIPFEPYDYQLKACYNSLVNKRQTNIAATSSGKSLMIYILCRYMLSKNKNILLIVPSIMLVKQMYEDFKSYGFSDLDDYVQLVGGEYKVKEIIRPLVISTWQSQLRGSKAYEDIDCVIVDEVHTAARGDNVIKKIITPACYNASFRFGFTGTLPKPPAEVMSILGCIGPTKKIISPRELIDRGLATEIEVLSLQLIYPEKPNLRTYHQEIQYLEQNKTRTNTIAKILDKTSKKGNTLGLVTHIQHGKDIICKLVQERLNTDRVINFMDRLDFSKLRNNTITFVNEKLDSYNKDLLIEKNIYSSEDLGIYFIYGRVDGQERERIRTILEEKENAVVLGLYSIMSTGVSIRRLHTLVLCIGTKSDIRLNQSLGRTMRKHSTKEKATIIDISDKFKQRKQSFSYRHYLNRLESYKEQEYNVISKEIVLEA